MLQDLVYEILQIFILTTSTFFMVSSTLSYVFTNDRILRKSKEVSKYSFYLLVVYFLITLKITFCIFWKIETQHRVVVSLHWPNDPRVTPPLLTALFAVSLNWPNSDIVARALLVLIGRTALPSIVPVVRLYRPNDRFHRHRYGRWSAQAQRSFRSTFAIDL